MKTLILFTTFLSSTAFADRLTVIGLEAGAGAPDGVYVGPTFRPLKFLRFNADVTSDYIAEGVKGGITIEPYFPIAPLLSAEIGHQFSGDANKLAHSSVTFLNNIDYSYVNLQPGIEFGSPHRFMFSIKAGMSYLWTTTNGLPAYVQSLTSQPLTLKEVSLQAWTPSAKIGFEIYIW